MRHNVGLRKLGRTSAPRRALPRHPATAFFRHAPLRPTPPTLMKTRAVQTDQTVNRVAGAVTTPRAIVTRSWLRSLVVLLPGRSCRVS